MNHSSGSSAQSGGEGLKEGAASSSSETPRGAARRLSPSEALSVGAQVARALAYLHADRENSSETDSGSGSHSRSNSSSSSVGGSGGCSGPGVAFLALSPRHVGLSADGAVAKLFDLSQCVRLGPPHGHSNNGGGVHGASTATAAAAAAAAMMSAIAEPSSSSSKQAPLKHLYLAPEVCLGKSCGAPADLFSLGLLLWELTHHKRAFPASTFNAYRELVGLGMRRPRVDLAASTSPSRAKVLPELLRCCWRSNAALRPRAELVANALAALAEDKPPPPFTQASGWSPLPRAAEAPGALVLPRHSYGSQHNGGSGHAFMRGRSSNSAASKCSSSNPDPHYRSLAQAPPGKAPTDKAASAMPVLMELRRYDMGPPSARAVPAAAAHPTNFEHAPSPTLPSLLASQKRPLENQALPAAVVSPSGASASAVHEVADAVAAAEAASSLLGLATRSSSEGAENAGKRSKPEALRSVDF